MSTYQYYEFQAIDRPLADEEQRAVASLSSRVDPHPYQAVFTYNWGSFGGDPEQVLTRYYDAMLYLASWGSRQLMFRFPHTILDVRDVVPYLQPLIVQDYISLSRAGDCYVLNIHFNPEDGGYGWIEGAGLLPALLPLRDDLARGDYRALYLVWLHVLEVEDLLDSIVEPPVPPGLGSPTPALEALVKFFEIDPLLVDVAAGASHALPVAPAGWLDGALARLSSQERDAFVRRLAEGEPQLSAALHRRLREVAPLQEPVPGPPRPAAPLRTVGQLRQETEERWERERRRREAEAEARRIAELEALAGREAETWAEVETLIAHRQGKPYDEAVALLVKLRDLAAYRDKKATFQQRIDDLYHRYPGRTGLLRRMREAGLHSS